MDHYVSFFSLWKSEEVSLSTRRRRVRRNNGVKSGMMKVSVYVTFLLESNFKVNLTSYILIFFRFSVFYLSAKWR
jgi:hypothetical protein